MKRDEVAIACIQGRPIRRESWASNASDIIWQSGGFYLKRQYVRTALTLEEADDWIVVGEPELCVCGHESKLHDMGPCDGIPAKGGRCYCNEFEAPGQKCEPPEPDVLRLPTVWRFGELWFIAPGEHTKTVANAGGYSTGDYRFAGLVYTLPSGREIITKASLMPIWCGGCDTWTDMPTSGWTRTYPVAVLMSKVGEGEK